MGDPLSTEQKVSRPAWQELLMVLWFLPAMVVSVWLGYPILIARLAWDLSGKWLKEFHDE